jgi:hypothetical protein
MLIRRADLRRSAPVRLMRAVQEYWSKRSRQAVCLLGSLIVISYLVLASALAWGPHHCKLAFPMVVGCALGSYEALAGGLIAASAALIAGWLAWTISCTSSLRLGSPRKISSSISVAASAGVSARTSSKVMPRFFRLGLRSTAGAGTTSQMVSVANRAANPSVRSRPIESVLSALTETPCSID